MALTSGTKVGPYEIQSLLGAGGMGEVYRARDTRLKREVAIKVLRADLTSDADLTWALRAGSAGSVRAAASEHLRRPCVQK
jgi:serine/threonine protein kinase